MALRVASVVQKPEGFLTILQSLRGALNLQDIKAVNEEIKFYAEKDFVDSSISLPTTPHYCVVPEKIKTDINELRGAGASTYRPLGLSQVLSLAQSIGVLFLQPQPQEPHKDLYDLFFVVLKIHGEEFNSQRRLLDQLFKDELGETPEVAREKLRKFLDELVTYISWFVSPGEQKPEEKTTAPQLALPDWVRELDKKSFTGIKDTEINDYFPILHELSGYLSDPILNHLEQVGVKLRPQLQEHIRVLTMRLFLNKLLPRFYQENAQKPPVFQFKLPVDEFGPQPRPFIVSSVNAQSEGQLQAVFTLEDSETITENDRKGFELLQKIVEVIEKYLQKPPKVQEYAGSTAAEDGGDGGGDATQDLPNDPAKQESIITLLTQADLSYGVVAGRMQAMLLPQFFRIHGFEDNFIDLINRGEADPTITEAYQQTVFHFQSELERVLRNWSPEQLAQLKNPEGRLKLLRELYLRLSQNPKFVGQVLLIKEKYAEFRAEQPGVSPEETDRVRAEAAKNIEENAQRFLDNAAKDLSQNPDAKNEQVWNTSELTQLQLACEAANIQLTTLQSLNKAQFETLIGHLGFDNTQIVHLTSTLDALVYVRISPEKIRHLSKQQFISLFQIEPPQDEAAFHQLCVVLAQYLFVRQERLNTLYQTNEFSHYDDEQVLTSNLTDEEIGRARWAVAEAKNKKISPLSFARAAHFYASEARASSLAEKGHEAGEETEVAHGILLDRRAREYQRLVAEMEFMDRAREEQQRAYQQAVYDEFQARGAYQNGALVVDAAALQKYLTQSGETEFSARSGALEINPQLAAAMANGAASPFLNKSLPKATRSQRLQALKKKVQQLKGVAELAAPGGVQKKTVKMAAQALPAAIGVAGLVGQAQGIIIAGSFAAGGAVLGILFPVLGPLTPLVFATVGGVVGTGVVIATNGGATAIGLGSASQAAASAAGQSLLPAAAPTAAATTTVLAPTSSTALVTGASVIGATLIPLATAILTTSTTIGSFLPPLPTIGSDGNVSPYLTIEKKATPISGGAKAGKAQNSYDDSYFTPNLDMKYTITIKANKGYKIKINSIQDVGKLAINTKESSRKDDTPPQPNPAPDFSQFVGKELTVGSELKIAEYTISFDKSYMDTNFTNNVSIVFQAFNETNPAAVSESHTAQGSESICIGKCPQAEAGCWPTNGTITQLPYAGDTRSGTSHDINRGINYNSDAFDIGAQANTPIYSPFEGQACLGGADPGYGVHVTLQASDGNAYLFGHMNSSKISGCQQIKQGDQIGVVGSTGNSTGPHLHYGILKAGGSYANSNIRKLVPQPDINRLTAVRSCYNK